MWLRVPMKLAMDSLQLDADPFDYLTYHVEEVPEGMKIAYWSPKFDSDEYYIVIVTHDLRLLGDLGKRREEAISELLWIHRFYRKAKDEGQSQYLIGGYEDVATRTTPSGL